MFQLVYFLRQKLSQAIAEAQNTVAEPYDHPLFSSELEAWLDNAQELSHLLTQAHLLTEEPQNTMQWVRENLNMTFEQAQDGLWSFLFYSDGNPSI